ncbi:hypothetical protein C7S20_10875 [Christiangramia fulva]|uniref:Anti-sigma factor n=1 Tax=Christiangramia fulva TaxID=2126553 RepID=A0A2R3Z625_9FLAO|nr:hypothetical protein [Christiangramia fulva]AVR45715.1 hypothetical protein C7S20_10875 [Christiangramia fulva]
MGQDIREMFRNQELRDGEKLNKGHQKRFEARLDEAFPQQKKKASYYQFLKIAAVLVVALGVGFYFLNNNPQPTQPGNQIADTPVKKEAEKAAPDKQYKLSDDSPQFKKIEDYYMASVNIQLAKLDVTPENKELIDAFMNKLETLDEEYKKLNNEIQQSGINEETVEAMISNLQLRLDLLKKLKSKLNELKQSKNEKYENYQA